MYYENAFVATMASEYRRAGFNLLAFNTRGAGCVIEAYRGDALTYVGGALERFEDSTLDVAAAIDVAEGLGGEVVLQGHSYGCDKVLYHDVMSGGRRRLILLSPADSYALQSNYLAPETVEEQAERLRKRTSDGRDEFVMSGEYGVRQAATSYEIPVNLRSLHDTLVGEGLNIFRYSTPWPHRSAEGDAFVYLGARDGLQTTSLQAIRSGLRERLRNAHLLALPDGDHHFDGCERLVVGAIAGWLTGVVDGLTPI
jgi:hypothetical protein